MGLLRRWILAFARMTGLSRRHSALTHLDLKPDVLHGRKRTATPRLSRSLGAYVAIRPWVHSMNDTIRSFRLALATSVLLLLAGCVSAGGYGSDRGSYGQPAPGYPAQYDSRLQGTVDGVDPACNRIFVVVDDPRSGRSQRMEVRYDQRIRLIYQGRERPLQGLERGDVIRTDVAQSGRELWASSIEVLSNVRDGSNGGSYGNDLRDSVAFVDARAADSFRPRRLWQQCAGWRRQPHHGRVSGPQLPPWEPAAQRPRACPGATTRPQPMAG